MDDHEKTLWINTFTAYVSQGGKELEYGRAIANRAVRMFREEDRSLKRKV